jgi:hypothetical protein
VVEQQGEPRKFCHVGRGGAAAAAGMRRGCLASGDESTGALRKLAAKFKDIFSDTADLPAAKHGVTQRIITDGRPVSARYCRLDATKLAAAKAEFQLLEDAGIVLRSQSQWASPLHMVTGLGGRAAITGG